MSYFESLERIKTLARPSPIDTSRPDKLRDLLRRHKLTTGEFEKILRIIGRSPSMTELGVFSAMWSEHCSYKSSKVHLRRFPTSGERVIVGPGENAGVVELADGLCAAFKMESHNHPSYIEPYQGAATGVGGILRDVFCMGARPIANLNCLRFGSRDHSRTAYLVSRAVKGIGDYGNCVGIPTIGGSVSFDESYNGNCLVNAMTVGLIKKDKIFKGYAAGVGNFVVYVGSATGRDGVHGATMASDTFAETSDTSKTTVQVGDPFAEKLLMEATLEVLDKNLVVGIQDMGAAGLTSSSFEMADRASNGIYINLDHVPLRARDMTAYEIMLSESQERMLMVIHPDKWDELKSVLTKWELPHAIIGHVTDSGRMQVEARGFLEIDLPVSPLTEEAPIYEKPMTQPVTRSSKSRELDILLENLQSDLGFAENLFKQMLRDVGSKKDIFYQFDRQVGTKTVLGPEDGGAAVLWVRSNDVKSLPYLGVVVAAGCNERRVQNNPRQGASEAVRDCAREIVAAGGKPIAVTDCLNFGNADDPEVMRQFSDSVDGISAACKALEIPVISGNVSLYNATGTKNIFPTPMIGMVGMMNDVRQATPAVLSAGEQTEIYELRPATDFDYSLAASLAAKNAAIGADAGSISDVNWESEKRVYQAIDAIRATGALIAARPISEGGSVVAIFKMLSRLIPLGLNLDLRCHSPLSLFGEGGARFLVCLEEDKLTQVKNIIDGSGLVLELVASTSQVNNTAKTKSPSHLGEMNTYFGTLSLKDLWLAFNSFLTDVE
jgi:phosphoribosylformylglycinamidine synthase subunit PurL